MKLAIIGDIHADQNKVEETRNGMKKLLGVLDDHDVTWLIITGDLFHEFNIGGKHESFGNVFDSVNTPLNDFLQQDERRRILIIPGNHDTPTNKNSKDALTSFEHKDRIHISRDITSFKLDSNLIVTTLPWMYPHRYKDKNELLDRLQELSDKSSDDISLLVGHCEIDGCDLQTGYTMLGGNFSFTKKQIDNLGFDNVALGHIHKRQYHFGGLPWQHNFGDDGLVGKVRIIEVDNKNIISDEFVEIPNTAKYYNIDVKDVDTFKCNKIDHVKVRGTKLDKVLPEGYKFEKTKEIYKPVARVNISPNDSVEELLKKYLKEKKVTGNIKDLTNILDGINVKDSFSSGGSLSKIISIQIKGIGSHKDTFINFKDPIIAISGSNGSGKTLMIECIFASLYGYLPSYGKIANMSDDKSLIICTFMANDSLYKVVRKVSKGNSTAFLYKDNNIKPDMGPKISEVNNYIRKLVGPEELILSSVFSTQFYEGDIVDLEPRDRKKIFHKLLGLNNLSEIKDVIDGKLSDKKENNEILSNQYKVLPTIDQIEFKTTNTKKEFLDSRLELKDTEKQRNDAKENSLKLVKKYNDFERDITIKQTQKDNLSLVVEIIEKLKREKVSYKTFLDNIKYDDRKKWEDKLKIVKEELHIEDGKYNKQRIEFDESNRLNKIATDKQEEYNRCNQNIEAIKSKYDDDTKKEMESQLLLTNVGCKDKPIPCKFIDNAIKIVDSIGKTQLEFIHDCKTLDTKLKRLYEEKNIAQQDKEDFKVTEIDAKVRVNLLEEVEKIEKELKIIDSVLLKETEYRIKLENANKNLIEKEGQKISIDKIIESMYNITYDEFRIVSDESSEELKLINTLDDKIDKLNINITENRKELQVCKEELIKINKYDEDIKSLSKDIDKLGILSKAFGKDGIPQLIIDSSLPQLQDILNLLTKSISKFDIRIATQKTIKSGDARETIDFIVDDGRRKRDIKLFSGGEKKLLKSLIRLSLSIFQSQKSGKSYKVLLLDEAFDSLDRDNSIVLLKMIYNLKKLFNQIFIISHSTDVTGSLSTCIEFKNNGERTVIV